MRRLHLLAGFLTLAVFLGTGQYMRHWLDVESYELAERFFVRSRHIYILLPALVHLALAAGVAPAAALWRRRLQWVASLLLVAASALIVTGFFRETPEAFPGSWNRFGLYAMLGGTLLHLAATWRRPGNAGA